ncbi:hypothetical protein ACIBQ1_48260 [Nonomuraea sp. NPDC050153]|uniref:hypothetical protein n=1 Tax=Nonomuraea sp. NPDC050153 TaxID=3364359 RepID=UPI0037BDBD58
MRSYWRDLRDRPHPAEMVARVARVEAVVCGSVRPPEWAEFARRDAEPAAAFVRA